MSQLIIVPVFDDPLLWKPLAGMPVWTHTASFASSLGVPVVVSVPGEELPGGLPGGGISRRPTSLIGRDEILLKIVAYELSRQATQPEWITVMSPRCPFRRKTDYEALQLALRPGWAQGCTTVVYDEPDTMVQLRSGARDLWHRNEFQRPLHRIVPSMHSVRTSVFRETGSLMPGKAGILRLPEEYALTINSAWDLMSAEARHDALKREPVWAS